MVILKNIYSETNLFDAVPFHDGINIIQGIYKKKQRDETTDLNGVGKSTLVRLIDFCLLSDTTHTNFFNTDKYGFLSDNTVSLEFEHQNQKYKITRGFTNPNEPIFSKNNKSENYDIRELRLILGSLFFAQDKYSGYFNKIWFRTLMNFFVKDDINHQERNNPLKFYNIHASDFDAYTYNLFLLNISNKSVIQYDIFKNEKMDLGDERTKLLSSLEEESGKSYEEIKSEVRFLDDKISSYEKSLSKYEFLDSYKDVEQNIIKTTNEISMLLRKLNILQKKLNEYQISYDYQIEININEIARTYGEIKKIFGEVIKKELDAIIDFRRILSENRMKFLQDKELSLKNDIEKIYDNISMLEKKRSDFYKILDEKKALDSIKNAYSQMIENKTKKERLVTSIKRIDQIDNRLYDLNKKISNSIELISKDVNTAESTITMIHSIFSEIVHNMIHVEDVKKAVFDITSSPDLRSPFKISIDVPKSSSYGKNRFKILAYDLTVFFNIIRNNRQIPHFLVHDGVFHGIDKKTVVRILNYIYSEFLKYHNFQYIITANEGELEIPEEKKDIYGQYKFDIDKAITVTYMDTPNKMIFKREY